MSAADPLVPTTTDADPTAPWQRARPHAGELAGFPFAWRHYHIDVARTEADRQAAFRLRHQVFLDELVGRPRADGIDQDTFDAACDHLLLRHAASGELVGTCRLAASLRATPSYAAGEFALDGLADLPGIKVEVGRTCLAAPSRNTLTLVALGQGIGAYARAVGARWLFGCSSIPPAEPQRVAALAARFIAQGMTEACAGIQPLPAYRDPQLTAALTAGIEPASDHEFASRVPALLRIYLRADAAVAVEPAFDRDFGCYDFFTLLDLQAHDSVFLSRFGPTSC